MPIFQITTKHRRNVNGILIAPGLPGQVVSQRFSNPVATNGGQPVVDAFMRV